MIAYPLGVGTTRTRALEAGSGSAVLFIHGLGARADRWCRNLEALAGRGYRCVALDLPGHGFADKADEFPYGVPGYAHFVLECMHSLQIRQAAIVGTSLGGHIAAYLACQRPEAVSALALVGTIGLAPLGAEVRDRIADNVGDTSREGIARKLRYVLTDHSLITHEWIEEEYRINNSPGAERAFARLASYFKDDAGIDRDTVGDQLALLSSRIPMLVVWGKADTVVSVAAGERGAASLGVPLVTLEGAGHLPYLERADQFNLVVGSFLGRALLREATGPAIAGVREDP
jgi:2-hydroxy-6-oxonona-2,4-dienedioate hydrolase